MPLMTYIILPYLRLTILYIYSDIKVTVRSNMDTYIELAILTELDGNFSKEISKVKIQNILLLACTKGLGLYCMIINPNV